MSMHNLYELVEKSPERIPSYEINSIQYKSSHHRLLTYIKRSLENDKNFFSKIPVGDHSDLDQTFYEIAVLPYRDF